MSIGEQVKQIRRYVKDYRHPFHNQGVEIYGTDKVLEQAADTIEALSAKLQAANMERSDRYYGGGWIACEDRLPELNHFYIVTIFDGEDYRVEPAYYAKIGYLGMRELKPNWWTDCTSNAEMIEDGEDKVIAWQPLPEPYRQ